MVISLYHTLIISVNSQEANNHLHNLPEAKDVKVLFMDKKVYYEEYTLKYWIELLLKKDLELPPYQRSFVWTDGQVKQSRTPNYIVHRLHYEGMILLDLTKTK